MRIRTSFLTVGLEKVPFRLVPQAIVIPVKTVDQVTASKTNIMNITTITALGWSLTTITPAIMSAYRTIKHMVTTAGQERACNNE